MNFFDEIRDLPETKRLLRSAAITAALWLAALIVFFLALSALSSNEERFSEATRVLNAAVEIKSYPEQGAASGREPLSAVTAILDKQGLQSRVSQLSSSPAGLLLQVNRLYPEELSRLVEELHKNGLTAKTAEIRTLTGKQDGRLINLSITREGEEK